MHAYINIYSAYPNLLNLWEYWWSRYYSQLKFCRQLVACIRYMHSSGCPAFWLEALSFIFCFISNTLNKRRYSIFFLLEKKRYCLSFSICIWFSNTYISGKCTSKTSGRNVESNVSYQFLYVRLWCCLLHLDHCELVKRTERKRRKI